MDWGGVESDGVVDEHGCVCTCVCHKKSSQYYFHSVNPEYNPVCVKTEILYTNHMTVQYYMHI